MEAVIDIFKSAYDTTKKNFSILLGTVLVFLVVNFLLSLVTEAFTSIAILYFVFNLVSLMLQLYVGIILIKLGLAVADNKEPEFSDVLPNWAEFFRYVRVYLLLIIIFMLVLLLTMGLLGMLGLIKPGLMELYKSLLESNVPASSFSANELLYAFGMILLFAIPAILLSMRLQFANYLVIDKKLEPVLAIGMSFRMTKGYLFFMLLVFIGILILNIIGLLLLGIGLLFTIPMSFIVMIYLYKTLLDTEIHS